MRQRWDLARSLSRKTEKLLENSLLWPPSVSLPMQIKHQQQWCTQFSAHGGFRAEHKRNFSSFWAIIWKNVGLDVVGARAIRDQSYLNDQTRQTTCRLITNLRSKLLSNKPRLRRSLTRWLPTGTSALRLSTRWVCARSFSVVSTRTVTSALLSSSRSASCLSSGTCFQPLCFWPYLTSWEPGLEPLLQIRFPFPTRLVAPSGA